jgi:hypothetical protein
MGILICERKADLTSPQNTLLARFTVRKARASQALARFTVRKARASQAPGYKIF